MALICQATLFVLLHYSTQGPCHIWELNQKNVVGKGSLHSFSYPLSLSLSVTLSCIVCFSCMVNQKIIGNIVVVKKLQVLTSSFWQKRWGKAQGRKTYTESFSQSGYPIVLGQRRVLVRLLWCIDWCTGRFGERGSQVDREKRNKESVTVHMQRREESASLDYRTDLDRPEIQE